MSASSSRRAVAVLAGLLCPGSGHAVLGRMRRGAIWAMAYIALGVISAHVPYLLFAWVIFHFLAPTVDLLRLDVAAAEVPPPGKALIACILLIAGVFIGRQAVRHYMVEAFKIPSESMVPTLLVGDHIIVSKLVYRVTEPERGDLVVYASLCQPERDYVHRIVALGGDTVAVACDRLHVNGTLVPQQLIDAAYSYDSLFNGLQWEQVPCARHRETIGAATYEICLLTDRRDHLLGAPNRETFPFSGNAPGPSCRDDLGATTAVPQVLGRVEPVTSPSTEQCLPRWQYVVPAGHVFMLGDNRSNSRDSRSDGPVPAGNIKGKVLNIWWSKGPDGNRWDRLGAIDTMD